VDLSFATESLRTVCETEERAANEFGADVAKVLQARISDLEAASSPDVLPAGRPRLYGDSGDHMAVDLAAGRFLVFRANHKKRPVLADGSINWSKVSRIQIVTIGK
jgi:proteic killer suppression protein